MKYILSIAFAVLFCLPATASASYRLDAKQAKRAIEFDVSMLEIAWKDDNFAPEMKHAIHCDQVLSRVKRRCYVEITSLGDPACDAGFSVEARPRGRKHVLVSELRWDSCTKEGN